MARRETPASNAGEKRKVVRRPARSDAGRRIVGNDTLEAIKQRAEELGLILHARDGKGQGGTPRKKKAKK